MKGVPPEVDRLMWAVAENGTEQAIHEFVGRYPQHRGELMHRVNMVAGLRDQVRQPVRPQAQIPKFVPREPIQSPNPRVVFLVGGLCLAALAAASYTAVTALRAPSHPSPVAQVATVIEGPLKVPSTVFVNPAPTEAPPPAPVEEAPKPTEDRTPAYLRSQTRITIKDESLAVGLQSIAAAGGMNLEIGPGFVDQKITVDYRDMSALDALQDMAKQYAFTVFDEGDGRFLVLPVADSPQSGAETGAPRSSRPTKRVGP
jgi:hypothetical protein